MYCVKSYRHWEVLALVFLPSASQRLLLFEASPQSPQKEEGGGGGYTKLNLWAPLAPWLHSLVGFLSLLEAEGAGTGYGLRGAGEKRLLKSACCSALLLPMSGTQMQRGLLPAISLCPIRAYQGEKPRAVYFF